MQAKRNMYIQLLDANTLFKREAEGYDWIRIDKSTLGEVSDSVQTENRDYIDSAAASTEVTGHQLSQAQEIILDTNNPCFRAIDNFYRHYYTGVDCTVAAAQTYPLYTADGTINPEKWIAQIWDEATVMVTSLNYKEGKYSMTINYNGDPKNGYITKDESGKFAFEEDDTVLDEIVAPAEVQTFSTRAKKDDE